MYQKDPINKPLFHWDNNDSFLIRDMLNGGILCTGSTGSGKTSGFGNLIAGRCLSNNFGFLVLTVKESEKQIWLDYCRKYNREIDLVIFGPNSGHSFNFLDNEINNRQDSGTGIAHNIADVLYNVIKSGNNDGHQSDKAFWDNSLKQLLINSVDLAMLTKNTKFEHIYKIVQSAPRHKQELHSVEWQKSSKCFRLINHISEHLQNADKTVENDELAIRLENIESFFFGSWLNLSEKTRSIVEQIFYGMSERFMRAPLRDLFSNDTTIRPEDTIKGKIILIDLPVLIYDEVGRDAQNLWKYLWQRSMSRRVIKNNSRGVCLWADEFQNFINPEKDIHFQSIAREYRACSVFITQNLPGFYLNAGNGDLGKTRFKALAGNLGTKFFLANTDPETNEFASELIGKKIDWSANEGQTMGENTSFSSGQSETLQYKVPPSEFATLKTGGPQNNYWVQAYVHRQGRPFRYHINNVDGDIELIEDNYRLIHLKQNIS